MRYLRESIPLPELTLDNINRIELVPFYGHKFCKNGTVDKEIIKEFLHVLKNKKVTSTMLDGASTQKKVLLYSDKLPGVAFNMPIWEMSNKYWLEYPDDSQLIKVEKELLNKIPGCGIEQD